MSPFWNYFYQLFMSVPMTWGQACFFWLLMGLSIYWIDKKNYSPNCICRDPRARKALEDHYALVRQTAETEED